jgi:hypothetical protein
MDKVDDIDEMRALLVDWLAKNTYAWKEGINE